MSPFGALAAVLVLSAALSTYALAFANAPAPTYDRERANAVLTGARDTLYDDGAANPAALEHARPETTLTVNLTLGTANRTWTVGPRAPRRAASASERLPVRTAPGRVRPGYLRARVWT